LILRKIIKTVANRCQILRLKCIKIDFGWGSARRRWELTVLSRLPSWNKGYLLLREVEAAGRGREKREGKT